MQTLIQRSQGKSVSLVIANLLAKFGINVKYAPLPVITSWFSSNQIYTQAELNFN